MVRLALRHGVGAESSPRQVSSGLALSPGSVGNCWFAPSCVYSPEKELEKES